MKLLFLFLLFLQSACIWPNNKAEVAVAGIPIEQMQPQTDSVKVLIKSLEIIIPAYNGTGRINTGNTSPGQLVQFAKSLIGTPYLYASADPGKGFDCSGFITYVFNQFKIAVPRSSVDFTDVQHKVLLQEAKPGDLILFTGTDSTIKIVGHMGIITENKNGDIKFIHSTSGKKYGVTITPLKKYYMGRFIKVVRIFNENSH